MTNDPLDRDARGPAGFSVKVNPDHGANASRVEEIVRSELARVERMFDCEDGDSMLSRWIGDPSIDTTGDFERLLVAALGWQRLSRGSFNVRTRRLQLLWERAAVSGCRPSPGELHEIVDEIADAPYCLEGGRLRQLRGCDGLDVSAIARGFAVEAAADQVMRTFGLGGVAVRAHDRQVCRGAAAIATALGQLGDPFGMSDFVVSDAAATVVSSSGPAGGRRDPVFDPLTGGRAPDPVSVIVVAPDAVTSDAVAAAIRTMGTARALDFVRELNQPSRRAHPSQFSPGIMVGPIRCRLLDSDGVLHDSDESFDAAKLIRPLGVADGARRRRPGRRDRRRLTLPWGGSRTVES